MTDETTSEAELRDVELSDVERSMLKYTRVDASTGMLNTTKHSVYLEIGNQGFRMDVDPEDEEHAIWYAQMLAKALAKVYLMDRPTVQKHPFKSTTHEEFFVHFHGGVSPYKAITAFLRKDKLLGEHEEWLCALARCSPGDSFSRPIGRSLARRRYFANRDKGVWMGGPGTTGVLCAGDKPTYDEVLAHVHAVLEREGKRPIEEEGR